MKNWLRRYLPVSLHDLVYTSGIIAAASLVCFLLKPVSDSDFHVPLIFVLAVLLVSLSTDGYLFGLLASVVSVLGVNLVFTYPYFQMDFSLTGYPLTFLCMFAVSLITCTLTTRIRHNEQALLEAEREKMRANLLRSISHDFRTPLTSLIGGANAVLEDDGKLTELEKRELISDVKSEAEWLFNMVENLLSITRIERDPSAALHKEPQLAEEVLSEAISRFRAQFADPPVEVELPDPLLFVEMDAVLIEQVMLNLLINAAKHARGATVIRVSVRREGDSAVFRFDDDGCGIPRETLPHLFEGRPPRTQGGDSARYMGIGLSVCQTIIQAHGGSISAHNLPEGGASFRFSLPCIPQEGASDYEREDPDR